MPTPPTPVQITKGLSLWLDEKRGSRQIPTPDAAPPVPGRLYPLTPADLTAADAYEGEAYRRVRVTTEAGVGAWVYVAAEG